MCRPTSVEELRAAPAAGPAEMFDTHEFMKETLGLKLPADYAGRRAAASRDFAAVAAATAATVPGQTFAGEAIRKVNHQAAGGVMPLPALESPFFDNVGDLGDTAGFPPAGVARLRRDPAVLAALAEAQQSGDDIRLASVLALINSGR